MIFSRTSTTIRGAQCRIDGTRYSVRWTSRHSTISGGGVSGGGHSPDDRRQSTADGGHSGQENGHHRSLTTNSSNKLNVANGHGCSNSETGKAPVSTGNGSGRPQGLVVSNARKQVYLNVR